MSRAASPAQPGERKGRGSWLTAARRRSYGGKVLVSSFGFNVAIDAMMRFLREEEKRGSFEVFDPDLRAAFWRAVADETWADGVATGRDADELFATPPWQRVEERRP